MEKVFIKTDGSLEMNRKVVSHLMSLGGLKPDFDYFVDYTTQQGASVYTLRTDTGVIGWSYATDWADHNQFKEIFLPESNHSKRHPHTDMILKWIEDTSQKVWTSTNGLIWQEDENPQWDIKCQYHIGETPPPNLEPVLWGEADQTSDYYIACASEEDFYYIDKDFFTSEKYMFDRKLVYSTPEGAIKRTKEMLGMAD